MGETAGQIRENQQNSIILEKKLCVHQVFRPNIRVPYDLRPDGVGECKMCEHDEGNGYCRAHGEMTVFSFYVHEKSTNLKEYARKIFHSLVD